MFFSTPLGRLVAGAVLITPVIAIAAYMASRPAVELPAENAPTALASRDRMIEIGGVRRPASDLEGRRSVRKLTAAERKIDPKKPAEYPYGRSPLLSPEENPSVASAYEALKTGKYPERITPLVSPEPYNRIKYEANKEEYLTTVEPGRVWQAAQPDEGVPAIQATVGKRHFIKQGESVRLAARTKPGAPVTFTSTNLGAFENRLPSITVAANQDGIAEAAFTGISGTIGKVPILASSPEASGRLRFIVSVTK